MAKLNGRVRRRSAFGLMLSGAATITFDQRMRRKPARGSTQDGVADAWTTVGRYLRGATTQGVREIDTA
ncbi:hypothetical protein [uncultured Sphingomonas sp.]|uniref:hypothetical protein n=1 Tax=uncultured Sphingomonas sp. TaxID=158754 RepID=UPI0035CA0CB4